MRLGKVYPINVIIMTKSYKNGGYCVAGFETRSRKWVRLVSGNVKSHGAIEKNSMSGYNVLDVVQVPVIGPKPTKYQPENVLVSGRQPWKKNGRVTLEYVLSYCHPLERTKTILGNQDCRVSEEKISTVGCSLTLVEVSNLRLYRIKYRTDDGAVKERTKADFIYSYNGRRYIYQSFSVTDPDYYVLNEDLYFQNAVLVLSLPDVPFMKNYYKFVAKIFQPVR